MRLGEKIDRKKATRGADLVVPERKLGLNEQLGLPRSLEDHMRSFLEVDFGDLKVYVGQLETAVGLITLFPEEAEQFRHQAPVSKALVRLNTNLGTGPSSDLNVRGLRGVNQLSPTRLNLDTKILEQDLEVLKVDRWINSRLELAAGLACLFPDHKTDIIREVKETLYQLEKYFVWIGDGSELWTMRDAPSLDPSLHPFFKAFFQTHRDKFENLFSKIRKVGAASEARSIATWFAMYKILLADEVRVTPSGILLAIERPTGNGKQPLPERTLA